MSDTDGKRRALSERIGFPPGTELKESGMLVSEQFASRLELLVADDASMEAAAKAIESSYGTSSLSPFQYTIALQLAILLRILDDRLGRLP